MASLLFLIKKVVSHLLYPIGVVLILMLWAAARWTKYPERKAGLSLFLLAGATLLFFSFPISSRFLLENLEIEAGAYADPALLNSAGVRHIVVLGGGSQSGDLTKGDRLNESTLKRLLEGVRLWRELPACTLVLSGGAFQGRVTDAEAMTDLALELGVPANAIIQERTSWDTPDQARFLRSTLRGRPFALVTSAHHMRRAITIFLDEGLTPLPAPADFRAVRRERKYHDFLPNGKALKESETAVHEYLGRAWYWGRRLIDAGQEQK